VVKGFIMGQHLIPFYQDRADQFLSRLRSLEKKSRNISMLRLAVFIFVVLLVYYFARQGSSAGILLSIGAGIIAFLALIRLHTRTLQGKNLQQALWRVNMDELNALNGDTGSFNEGSIYIDPAHPFSYDLDLFGEGSLFQFLNRTATHYGRDKLANLLKQPLNDRQDIIRMQQAVEEISNFIEWRQKFQAIGLTSEEGPDDRKKILSWASSSPVFQSGIYKFLVLFFPVATLAMTVFLGVGWVSVQLFLIYLLIPWGIAGSFAMKVNQRHNLVGKTSGMLMKYSFLLVEINALDPKAELLRQLKQRIHHKNITAGRSIESLSAILTALDNRLNFVSWALLNGLLLWDILQMLRLETWQRKYKGDLETWFSVIAEFDVINSFANFRFNQPQTVFPEITETGFQVLASEVGHPLIDNKLRVNNDFRIAEGEFLIITGANMAGKSTYLRTVGVNLVLAMSGAPVCASRFIFLPIKIHTSIRTSDSLKENESYFYAELKRLKAIIDEFRAGQKLFVILDEILRGTNSKDKHSGSEALIRQLVSLGATGIMATHDVLLGNLRESFPDKIRNHCFEVDIEGDQLHFDYRLRDGISKNLNATILMREMGITI
jgi:ABC-type multidrug transport system fused ATPase/permease subunit